jgi:hypothetical protein
MKNSIQDKGYPLESSQLELQKRKSADLLTLDPNSTYDLFDRHTITDEEERSWNQKSPAEKGGTTGSSFIEKTSFCSKMNRCLLENTESPATRKLFDIVANYPPKLTILASATRAEAKELAKTTELVRRKNPGLQVIEVTSKELQIGCQYCSFKGEVIFPHWSQEQE